MSLVWMVSCPSPMTARSRSSMALVRRQVLLPARVEIGDVSIPDCSDEELGEHLCVQGGVSCSRRTIAVVMSCTCSTLALSALLSGP